ncbi:MAG: tetratricopeptide repeat protein [Candidatus Aminicenantes bacterium]|nr:tetratricopeptide repeat protein [Candidatus Aminicenantes bacterium]NIM78626.1 tetratricopeptide repeat protein [Candidatus Aminicenantes bacterium]NIN17872.1 tetratricopeptide repeat protein [Candidatus Aminicenantes bacterium]NIN41776.1 tetratricopeptide repeat protein [Candidatus Aminicenantes bacterium]NIN84525.1 tetratricopeptide repeat protein [Candidatus Aminicenantes bacterium]
MEIREKQESNYRYPGLRPFSDTDHDRRLFFGRDEEIQYIWHSILVENLFVLFAKSGMGKTSLLHAGLMDLLRRNHFLPLVIRFNDRDRALLDTIYPGMEKAIARRNEAVDKNKKIDYEPGETGTLWQFFKTAAFWTADDKPLTPVLIFDQFEEFFTMHPLEHREAFIEQLADLVRGRVPRALRESFKSSQSHFPYSETPPKVKIIISLREDYLGYLEDLTREIPGILRNRFRLLPLTREQAREAIVKPAGLSEDKHVRSKGFSYTDEAVDEMLDFLCERRVNDKIVKTGEVEPFQLQLLCQHVEEKTIKRADKAAAGSGYPVQGKDLGGKTGMRRILQGFYEERLKTLGSLWKKRRVRKLCEKGLIESETRVSLHKEYIKRKYKVYEGLLDVLVDNRLLLRSEPRIGNILYELSHDTMIPPILRSRRERKIRNSRIGIPILVFILVFTGISLSKQIIKRRNIHKLYEDAVELTKQGKKGDAIKKYLSILRIDEKRAAPYMELGELYEDRRNPGEALEIYEKAIENKIGNEIIHYRLGKLYAGYKKKPEKAVEHYKKAIVINPEQPRYYIDLGNIYNEQGQFDEAVDNYNKALELDDKNTDAYKGLLALYIINDNVDEAAAVYERAVKANEDYIYIIKDIAPEIKTKGMFRELENLYQVPSRESYFYYYKKASYREKLGDMFSGLNDYERAIKNFEKALKYGSKKASVYKGLAVAYINRGEPGKAVDMFRKAVKVSTDHVYIFGDIAWEMKNRGMADGLEGLFQAASDIAPKKGAYYEELGTAFIYLEEYDRAIENYEKVLELDNTRATAYMGLAAAYIEGGNPGKAVEVYRSALRIGPGYAYIYKDLAWAMRKKKMTAELEELSEIASAVDSQEPAYYMRLGDYFDYLRKYDRAVEFYQKALALDNKKTSIYSKLARFYIKRGEHNKAIDVFRNAAAAGADYDYIYEDISWKFKMEQRITPDKRKELLEKLLKISSGIDSQKASYYKKLGYDFFYLSKYDRAIESYKKALELDDKDKDIYIMLVYVYITQGEFAEVIDIFRSAVNAGADYVYIYRNIVEEIKGKNMTGELEKLLQTASEVDSKKASYYEAVAGDFNFLKKYNRAIEFYEKALALDDKTEAAYKGLANAYINRGIPEKAIDVYRNAVTTRADYASIYRYTAEAMGKKGMTAAMEKLYRAASEIDSKEAVYYEKLGAALVYLKEYDRAIENYKKALDLDTQNASIYKTLAVTYVNRGMPEKAIDVFRIALKKIDDYDPVYRGIADAMKKKKMDDELETLLQIASKIDSKEDSFYRGLGIDFNYLKKYDRAIEFYKKALALHDGNAYTYKGLAITYLNQGKPDKAVEVCRNAVKSYSGFSWLYKDLAREMKKRGMEDEIKKLLQ